MIFRLLHISKLLFKVLVTIYNPLQLAVKDNSLISFEIHGNINLCVLFFLNWWAWYAIVHCAFNLYFPICMWEWASFYYFIDSSAFFFILFSVNIFNPFSIAFSFKILAFLRCILTYFFLNYCITNISFPLVV